VNIGHMVTPGNDGFDPDWASKPDANVVADDAEHWLHQITMADSKIATIARGVVESSRQRP
jgi:hypothetical protein